MTKLKINSHSNSSDPSIGRFMIGVGALIFNSKSQKILLTKRSDHNFQSGEWEIVYGRVKQHEELIDALKREVEEETQIKDLKIHSFLRSWHIYRGQPSAKTELFGFTFICSTNQDNVVISSEHSEYRFVSLTEAKELVKIPGIKTDLELYEKYQLTLPKSLLTNLSGETIEV